MTSRVRGPIHAPRGRMLPFTATDTAQNSMHCKLLACPRHLVPTIDLSAHTSQWTRQSVKHRRTTCAACIPTSFWARSIRCTQYSGCLVSPFRLHSHARCRKLSVTGNRWDLLIARDVLDHFTMFSACRFCLTPLRPSTPASNVLPLSGNVFFSCIRASLSEPSVSCLNRPGFRTLALSRWSALGGPPPAPTRLGYGDASLSPLRVVGLSPSKPWCPLVHVA